MCFAPTRNQTPVLGYQFSHGTKKIRRGDTNVDLYFCFFVRNLALNVKQTNLDFHLYMKMIVDW